MATASSSPRNDQDRSLDLDTGGPSTAEPAGGSREAMYRALFDSIDQAFCVIEMLFDEAGEPVDFRYIETNPAFIRHATMPMLGKRIKDLVPNFEQYWINQYGQVAITGEAVHLESRVEGLDDQWFETHAARIGGEGSPLVAVLFTNITERKRAQESLREEDRRKDEFLAMLAHELRNPLGSMRSAITLAEARLRHGEPVTRPMEILSRQTARLARLVDDLVDVSRISRGTIELRRDPVDVSALLERSLEAVQSETEHEYDVRLSLPHQPLTLYADALRLEQVMTNLVGNALKYTDPGGRIDLSARADDGQVEIRVRDSGIGIEQPFLDRMFNLFEQSDRSLDRSRGGLGIGLTVAKQLVELHGGTIEARSEGRGQGSEFVVRLPLGIADHHEGRRGAVGNERHGTHRQVLVVDDSADNAEVLAELVRELGFEARIAPDGPSALRLAAEDRPDLVLLDIGLPGMTGYEVASRLRAHATNGPMKIVALTGYGQATDREQSAQAGFDEHIVKPISVEDLQRILGDAGPEVST